jgi:hypothetical protein
MPAQASRRERSSYRNDALGKIHSASLTALMSQVGLEPFAVHCCHQGWVIESLDDFVKRQKAVSKVFSQTRTSGRKMRRIIELLSEDDESESYNHAKLGAGLIEIMEQVSLALGQGMMRESLRIQQDIAARKRRVAPSPTHAKRNGHAAHD